jgi:truncated hemoglobin YjbI
MTRQTSTNLYDRLGGVYSIATVIDDFIDRIMVGARLNANPRVDEAHHRVSPAGFKYLVTEMVCWATGGPQKYTGRSMKESHQHLMITAAEWEAPHRSFISGEVDKQQRYCPNDCGTRSKREDQWDPDSAAADVAQGQLIGNAGGQCRHGRVLS